MESGRCKKILIFAIIIILLYFLDIGCPIKYVTGISCPGCGITRAVVACIHMDFVTAFHYYPMIVAMPIVIIILILEERIPERIRNILLYTLVAAFLIVYIIRMMDGSDDIVVFEPENNILFRGLIR